MNQKDEIDLILLHCFLHGEAITHFTHEFDKQLYKRLPNLYVVWMADNNPGEEKKLVAGFVFKTTRTNNGPEFLNAIQRIVVTLPYLRARLNRRSSFLPSRVRVSGGGASFGE